MDPDGLRATVSAPPAHGGWPPKPPGAAAGIKRKSTPSPKRRNQMQPKCRFCPPATHASRKAGPKGLGARCPVLVDPGRMSQTRVMARWSFCQSWAAPPLPDRNRAQGRIMAYFFRRGSRALGKGKGQPGEKGRARAPCWTIGHSAVPCRFLPAVSGCFSSRCWGKSAWCASTRRQTSGRFFPNGKAGNGRHPRQHSARHRQRRWAKIAPQWVDGQCPRGRKKRRLGGGSCPQRNWVHCDWFSRQNRCPSLGWGRGFGFGNRENPGGRTFAEYPVGNRLKWPKTGPQGFGQKPAVAGKGPKNPRAHDNSNRRILPHIQGAAPP